MSFQARYLATGGPATPLVPTLTYLRVALGYLLLLLFTFLLSRDRKQIQWRPVMLGLGLQFMLALVILHPTGSQLFFDVMDLFIHRLLSFAESGTNFVFQATAPHQVTSLGADGQMGTSMVVGQMSPLLKNLALWILPSIIFFSSTIAVFYHLGVMQILVGGMSWLMARLLRSSGAETLSCVANTILGMTEAPLFVKPFIKDMTKSELFAIMVGGFATMSGGMLVVYSAILADIAGIAGHLVVASLMAVPGSLAVSKILMPETGRPLTGGNLRLHVHRSDRNLFEAAARGAAEGMTLVINIVAMLIAFVGLLAMFNAMFALGGTSIEEILGWAFTPLFWAMGMDWGEAARISQLMGLKLVMTEFLSFATLRDLLASEDGITLSIRAATIGCYALHGFASLPAIGIQIGGIGGMAPSRQGELAQLGMRAMVGGAIVSALSGMIAGLFL